MESHMKNCKPSLGATFIFLFALTYPAVGRAQSDKPKLECKTGPISRVYGGTNWLIYSCTDGLSVTFVPAPGNAAMPAYFIITPQADHYHLYGERSGDVEASEAAIKEIQNLSKQDVTTLIAEAQSQKPTR